MLQVKRRLSTTHARCAALHACSCMLRSGLQWKGRQIRAQPTGPAPPLSKAIIVLIPTLSPQRPRPFQPVALSTMGWDTKSFQSNQSAANELNHGFSHGESTLGVNTLTLTMCTLFTAASKQNLVSNWAIWQHALFPTYLTGAVYFPSKDGQGNKHSSAFHAPGCHSEETTLTDHPPVRQSAAYTAHHSTESWQTRQTAWVRTTAADPPEPEVCVDKKHSLPRKTHRPHESQMPVRKLRQPLEDSELTARLSAGKPWWMRHCYASKHRADPAFTTDWPPRPRGLRALQSCFPSPGVFLLIRSGEEACASN